MGINKEPSGTPPAPGAAPGANSRPGSATPTKSSIETLAAAAAAAAAATGGVEHGNSAAAYSSLLDIGQAYGLWSTEDSSSGQDISR